MPNKLKGPGRFFSRFFVRPYEPIQVYGSVHNLARVGGVSILSIPKEYAPCDLVIPTRFAATGQFLVNSGTSSICFDTVKHQEIFAPRFTCADEMSRMRRPRFIPYSRSDKNDHSIKGAFRVTYVSGP